MSDLDFPGLRTYVESQTYLPEFAEVERRSRRHRRRRRAATVLTSASLLLVVLPAFIVGTAMAAGHYGPTGNDVAGLAGRPSTGSSGGLVIAPTKPAVPVVRTLVAADGIDLDHVFGLVDVCSGQSCDLQIVSITPQPQIERIGMLRHQPTDAIIEPRIVALSANTVVVSAGVGADKARLSATIPMPPPIAASSARSPDRPVQTSPHGRIQVARAEQPTAENIALQPTLTQPTLATSAHGWWVTGTDPLTGEAAVAVSRDGGRDWTVRTLGVLADAAAVATGDGTHVFMLIASAGQMLLTRSVDGGRDWSQPTVIPGWPTAVQFGLYVRRDGSLMAWFAATGGSTYLSSADGGVTFDPSVGPLDATGAVVALPGGFITLGQQPSISSDGSTWATPYVPYLDVSK